MALVKKVRVKVVRKPALCRKFLDNVCSCKDVLRPFDVDPICQVCIDFEPFFVKKEEVENG